MTSRDELTPANPDEVIDRIAFALRHRRTGKASRDYEQAMAGGAASHVLEMLRLSGFVVMRRAALQAHSAPTAWKPEHDGNDTDAC